MTDDPRKGPTGKTHAQSTAAEALASRVLSLVASRSRREDRFRYDLFDELLSAIETRDQDIVDRTVQVLRGSLSDADIVDTYIPAAARHFGELWCTDGMSFVDVTIGTSKLQAMLTDLRTRRVATQMAPIVLVVTPRDAHHTLGSSIVADQLRRLGVAVRVGLDFDQQDLANLLETHEFDAVFISASSDQRLEPIRALVDVVHSQSATPPPVILGGTVLEQATEIAALTGADHLTSNVKEALQLCGLTIPTTDAVFPEDRG
ncbi:MAG: cobalamin B12-binding domain-containing protein [Shimia sp.]